MATKLKTQRQALDDLWSQGLSGTSLLRNLSGLADEFIRDCFAGIDKAEKDNQVALVALGGYGRQELFPFSDIDLMILFKPEIRKSVGAIADAILYPLWDTGFEVGHGVRTIDESLKQAAEDIIFQIALLDGRCIGGSEELFYQLMAEFRHKFVDGQRREFICDLNELSVERRQRFGSHGYLLEPNIKESKGGFRDIQSMIWAAKVVFGISTFDEIIEAGFLLPSEGERFNDAHNMLVRIRNRLHYISGRKNDQLYFEQQEEMAESFDYSKSEEIDLVCLESPKEMPAYHADREEVWALGARFHTRSMPLEITQQKDKVTGLRVQRISWKKPDLFVPSNAELLAGTEYWLPGEQVVFAIGAKPAADLAKALAGVEVDRSGRIGVDPATGATSRPGVYAGGDGAVGGGVTIVKAVAEGKRAGEAIDEYLRG